MNTPSISLDHRQRYTPEVRDRVLATLRGAMQAVDQTAYRLLTPAHLRALAEFHSPDAPVLSVYLQLTPERRLRAAWHTEFKDLAEAMLEAMGARRKRDALKEDFDRIESALEASLPAMGRGAAFFVCRRRGLWRQLALPVPMPDRAFLRPRPYIRPLVRTGDEHERFVVALISQERSRFFISQIGQVEEVFDVNAERLRRDSEQKVSREHGGVDVPEPIKAEARVLAGVAEQVLALFEARHLLIAGTPELRSAVIHALSHDAQARVGGEFAVEMHANPAAVAAAAEPVQRAIEEHGESATIARLLEAAPATVAWDVPAVLTALYERRVMLLAADDGLCMPGSRCETCEALSDKIVSPCPRCGSSAIEPVEDVVELALEQALQQRGNLELVRSAAARQAMAARGPMAAELRW
jgi:predicted Zn-ribbon and HTH transcriptional regulator